MFLEYLKSKETRLQNDELKDIKGQKIRWQHFNAFLYIMLSVSPMPTICISILSIKDSTFGSDEFADIFMASIVVWFIVLASFIVLSLLNRFLFGKTVCVFNKDGLFLKNHVIEWSDINEIIYCPRIISRSKANYCFASVGVNEPNKSAYSVDIIHFPLYALSKAKKYNPTIKVRIDKEGIKLILFTALMPTVLSIILPLFF